MNSKMGWIIAGIIVLVVGGVILAVILSNLYSTSDPTEDTTAPGALDYQDVAVAITTIVPAEPSGSGNAADDYKKAVEIVKPLFDKALEDNPDHPKTILDDTAADIGTWLEPKVGKAENRPPNPEGLGLMEKIAACVADGAAKKEMKYPFDLDKMEVTYNLPEAKYFHVVSQALSDYAHYQVLVQKKPEEAQKVTFNRFIMGWHMAHDRVYPYFVCAGYEIERSACHFLADSDGGLYPAWPGHEAQAEKAQAYITAVGDVLSFFDNKDKYMFGKFARENERPNPGDIFNVVQNDKDPCWRVQGIFSLAMLKCSGDLLNSEHPSGDARRCQHLIEEKLKNGADEEKAAARAAGKFTKDDYTNIAGKNAGY